MGGKHALPAALLLTHDRHNPICDEAVVQVVLGLIDHQGRVGFKQKQEQHGSGLLAGR